MEWFGFLISYSMYLDLHTIIEDQEYRAKVKAAREKTIYDNNNGKQAKTDTELGF